MKPFFIVLATAVVAFPAMAEMPTREKLAIAMAADLPVVLAACDSLSGMDIENGIDINASGTDEIVDLGSITKTVMAVAILPLVESKHMTTQATLAELPPAFLGTRPGSRFTSR